MQIVFYGASSATQRLVIAEFDTPTELDRAIALAKRAIVPLFPVYDHCIIWRDNGTKNWDQLVEFHVKQSLTFE